MQGHIITRQINFEFNVGDKVKIREKKLKTEKKRTNDFSKGEYVLEGIFETLNQTH